MRIVLGLVGVLVIYGAAGAQDLTLPEDGCRFAHGSLWCEGVAGALAPLPELDRAMLICKMPDKFGTFGNCPAVEAKWRAGLAERKAAAAVPLPAELPAPGAVAKGIVDQAAK